MKKLIMPIAAILILAAASGCGKVDVDVKELASALAEGGKYAEALTEVSADITKKRYDLRGSDVQECAAYAGTRAVADEVAVFKSADTKKVEEKVLAHVDAQKKTYTNYRSEELEKLDDFILYTYNDTVIYCVGEDKDGAMQIITDYTTK